MKIRAIEKLDKEKILQAFKPILKGWDYLPEIIDSWFDNNTKLVTLVACTEDGEFIAMIQIEEYAPKRWFSRGLRANPGTDRMFVGRAITMLIEELEEIMHKRDALSVSFRTLEHFKESINLAKKNGFYEKLRFSHKWYEVAGLSVCNYNRSNDISFDFSNNDFIEFLRKNCTFCNNLEHFFTWHEIRTLTLNDIENAKNSELAIAQIRNGEITNAALFFHVPEIRYLFLSIVEGDNNFIREAFNFGIKKARELNCIKVGLIHPDAKELNRRQRLLGLETGQVYSILFHKQYRSQE